MARSTCWTRTPSTSSTRSSRGWRATRTSYAGTDIGRDNGGVVDLSYEDKKPFAFTGTVKKVVFDVKPHLSAQDEEALHAVAQHGHAGHGLSA